MPKRELLYTTFVLAVVLINLNLHATQKTSKRYTLFIDSFWTSFKSSQQALQVFDVSVSPIQASNDLFLTLKESLRAAGLAYPDSLAKAFADSVLLTLPILTQELYVKAIIESMAIYLIAQNMIADDNSAAKGNEFLAAILNNYPEKDNVTSFTLNRAFAFGVTDFLKAQGEDTLRNSAAVIMVIATHMFAHSTIGKPLIEVTVVSSPGLIPAAADLYGIMSFSSSFLTAVDSSVALQSIFYSNQPILEISNAWKSAAYTFCMSFGCYDPQEYRYELDIMKTYNYMSKSTYVKCIANAYALTMVAKGTLTLSNSIAESELLAKTMETIIKGLPENSKLDARLGVIFTSFKNLLRPEDNILNLYPHFGINIGLEFFAAVPVSIGL